MAYQNQSSAYVPAVLQLFGVTRDADLNQSEWHYAPDLCTLEVFRVSPKH